MKILIFNGELKLCIKMKDKYSANKVYNERKHTYKEICQLGDLEGFNLWTI